MAKEIIDIGIINDPLTGDSLYQGGTKLNNNFTELYDAVSALESAPVVNTDKLEWLSTDENGLYSIEKDGSPFAHNYTNNPSVTTPADDWMRNTFFGNNAGNYTGTGIMNVGIGAWTLNGLTTGTQNNMIGNESGANITTGGSNNGIGDGVMYYLSTGSSNVGMGKNALQRLTTGNSNVAIGKNAGYWAADAGNMTLGSFNTLIGEGARIKTDGNEREVVIGYNASGNGSDTVTIGGSTITETHLKGDVYAKAIHLPNSDAGITEGFISLGDGTPFLHNGGNPAGQSYYQNTYVGYSAGNFDGTSASPMNVGVGDYVLGAVTSGSQNTGVGALSLSYLTTGSNNVALGASALYSMTTGSDNMAQGKNAIQNMITGSKNIAIGRNSGFYAAVGTLTSGDSHVLIGDTTKASANGTVNEIVIGANAVGKGSHTVVLGHTSIVETVLRGKINANGLPLYADEASAITGGLVAGDLYRTSTGEIRIKL